MSFNSVVSDFYGRLSNSVRHNLHYCSCRNASITRGLVELMLRYNLIQHVLFKKNIITFDIVKFYDRINIIDLKLLSKPGCRVYVKYTNINKIKGRYSIVLMSTNMGIISCFDAKKRKIGGEPFVLLSVLNMRNPLYGRIVNKKE